MNTDEMACSTNDRNALYDFGRMHCALIKAFCIHDQTSYKYYFKRYSENSQGKLPPVRVRVGVRDSFRIRGNFPWVCMAKF